MFRQIDVISPQGEKLNDVYNIKKIFRQASDYDLNQGQLTSQGFFQQLQLGSLLNHVYRNYLSKIESPKQLNIRATNYARTLQVSTQSHSFHQIC